MIDAINPTEGSRTCIVDAAERQASTVVLNIGDLMVIRTTRALSGEFCQFALSPFLYAKLDILSVDVGTRLIQFREGFDPNCGFRSFQPGIPTG